MSPRDNSIPCAFMCLSFTLDKLDVSVDIYWNIVSYDINDLILNYTMEYY